MTDALLVIDLQRYVDDTFWNADAVLANTIGLVDRARAADVPVVWVQHSDSDMEVGTEPWELAEGLEPLPGEDLVHKTYRDSFSGTDLDQILKGHGADRLVLTGAQSDFCVRTAAQTAASNGYSIALVSDAHTTEDFKDSDGVRITGEAIVAHVNRYFAGLRYPDVTVEVVRAADVTLG